VEACTRPGAYELILVDNGSTEGTVEFLRAYALSHPQVQVVFNAHNLGFAAGNNEGLALAKATGCCS